MMKILIIPIISALFLNSCALLNNPQMEGSLYKDCKEYYDARGNYFNSCEEEGDEGNMGSGMNGSINQ